LAGRRRTGGRRAAPGDRDGGTSPSDKDKKEEMYPW